MRHVRWKGVVLGTVMALLTDRLLPLVTPDFYAMIAYEESMRGSTVMTTNSQTAALGVWLFVLIASWSLANLIGGLVAGVVADSAAGLNGMMTMMLEVVVGAAWVSWGVLGLAVGGCRSSCSLDFSAEGWEEQRGGERISGLAREPGAGRGMRPRFAASVVWTVYPHGAGKPDAAAPAAR